MKNILPVFWALLLVLVGCSKKESEPPQSLLIGTWTYQSESHVVTPPSGPIRTTVANHSPYTLQFRTDGKAINFYQDGTSLERTYTFNGTTITMELIGPNNADTLLLTVRELTATRLVTVKAWDEADGHHEVIDVSSR